MKPRYTDAFWGKHPFDGDIILYKNKNKNKMMMAVIIVVINAMIIIMTISMLTADDIESQASQRFITHIWWSF